MLVQIVQIVNVHHIHYTGDCVSQHKLYVFFFGLSDPLYAFSFVLWNSKLCTIVCQNKSSVGHTVFEFVYFLEFCVAGYHVLHTCAYCFCIYPLLVFMCVSVQKNLYCLLNHWCRIVD